MAQDWHQSSLGHVPFSSAHISWRWAGCVSQHSRNLIGSSHSDIEKPPAEMASWCSEVSAPWRFSSRINENVLCRKSLKYRGQQRQQDVTALQVRETPRKAGGPTCRPLIGHAEMAAQPRASERTSTLFVSHLENTIRHLSSPVFSQGSIHCG